MIDLRARVYVNPALRRVPGSAESAFLLGAPEQAFEMTPGTYALLDRLTQPRRLGEVLPQADREQLSVIAELLEQQVLLRADELPPPPPVRIEPVSPAIFGAPPWKPGTEGPGAVVVVGFPYDQGTVPAFPAGAAAAPAAVRRSSLRIPFRAGLASGRPEGWYDADFKRQMLAGVPIYDAGDLCWPSGSSRREIFSAASEELREIRRRGAVFLVLGGDHSLTAAAVGALREPEIGILHFDAHSDLARILHSEDVDQANVLRHVAELPAVKHVVQLGARGILPCRQDAGGADYETYPVTALRELDEEALGGLCRPDLPYYLSIDVDVLDPSVAPGCSAPVPEGLLLTELRRLIRAVTQGRRILGIDLVEVLPARDVSDLTCRAAVEVALEAMAAARPC